MNVLEVNQNPIQNPQETGVLQEYSKIRW